MQKRPFLEPNRQAADSRCREPAVRDDRAIRRKADQWSSQRHDEDIYVETAKH